MSTQIANVDEQFIQQYVYDHQNKFFINAPHITIDDIVVTLGDKDLLQGSAQVTIGLKQYYDATTGLLIVDEGNKFVHDFTIKGFGVTITKVAQNIFSYSEIYGANTPAQSLNDLQVDEQYFVNLILEKKNIIFENAPSTITASDLQNFQITINHISGEVEISFDLANALPYNDIRPCSFKIVGYTQGHIQTHYTL